jgi:hypothetical protein
MLPPPRPHFGRRVRAHGRPDELMVSTDGFRLRAAVKHTYQISRNEVSQLQETWFGLRAAVVPARRAPPSVRLVITDRVITDLNITRVARRAPPKALRYLG